MVLRNSAECSVDEPERGGVFSGDARREGERDDLPRRVQLVRRDGRDVSTLYGREGGGGVTTPGAATGTSVPSDSAAAPAPAPTAASRRVSRRATAVPGGTNAAHTSRDAACPISTG